MKKAFRIGSISLVFLIIGFQTALLLSRASILYIEAKRDRPDTVYIYNSNPSTSVNEDLASKSAESQMSSANRPPRLEQEMHREGTAIESEESVTRLASVNANKQKGNKIQDTVRRNATHSQVVEDIRRKTRKVESFRFNPNTVTSEELQRLGFSEKQAASIVNYRAKGGRFRRPRDFAKSYVVSDSIYKRLEPYIDIPKIDINKADSIQFIDLPGIGGYYASKIIKYRKRLNGFSYEEQLLDLIDAEKFNGLKDLITCSLSNEYPLWSLGADSLRLHPYIGEAAGAIVLFRESTAPSEWTIVALQNEGILSEEAATKLSQCRIVEPSANL